VYNIFPHTYRTHAFTPNLHFSPLYYPYIPFPLRPAALHFTSLYFTSPPFSMILQHDCKNLKTLLCVYAMIYVTPFPLTEGYRKISHLCHVVILRSASNWTSYKLHISRKSIIIKILHWKRLLSLLPHNFAVSHVVITNRGKFSYRSS
jgi:hypothetical protein